MPFKLVELPESLFVPFQVCTITDLFVQLQSGSLLYRRAKLTGAQYEHRGLFTFFFWWVSVMWVLMVVAPLCIGDLINLSPSEIKGLELSSLVIHSILKASFYWPLESLGFNHNIHLHFTVNWLTWTGSESSEKGDGCSFASINRTGKIADSLGDMAPLDWQIILAVDLSWLRRYPWRCG